MLSVCVTFAELAYGARPLKRFIQRHFETQLTRQLIEGAIPDGSTLHVSLQNGELTFQCLENKAE